MILLLRTLCLSVWALLAPGLERSSDASTIADSIAAAIQADAAHAPVTGSHAEDAVLMALFAFRESSVRLRVIGDGGAAHGPWQWHGPLGLADVATQAKAWLAQLHEGKRKCPESPSVLAWGACHGRDSLSGVDVAVLARKRERSARFLLRKVLGFSGSPENSNQIKGGTP